MVCRIAFVGGFSFEGRKGEREGEILHIVAAALHSLTVTDCRITIVACLRRVAENLTLLAHIVYDLIDVHGFCVRR